MPRVGSHISASDSDQINLKALEFFHDLGIRHIIISPSIAKYTINPPFEKRGHRPPIYWINQHECIGAIKPRVFGGYIGGRQALSEKDGNVGCDVSWIETLRR